MRPCPPLPDADEFFEGAMARVRQRARGAMAPVACVQAVRAAATLPYDRGMEREGELMATLFNSGQARALQYCFFAQRVVGKWSLPSGARWDNSKARLVCKAAVIGERVCLKSHKKCLLPNTLRSASITPQYTEVYLYYSPTQLCPRPAAALQGFHIYFSTLRYFIVYLHSLINSIVPVKNLKC